MSMISATIESEIKTTFNKLNLLQEKILFEYYSNIIFSVNDPIIPASFIDQNFKYLNISAIWDSMHVMNLTFNNEKDFEEWIVKTMPLYYKMLSLYSHFGSCISIIPPCAPFSSDDSEYVYRQIAIGYKQLLGLFLVPPSGETIPIKTIASLIEKHKQYDNIAEGKIPVLQKNFKILKVYANNLYEYISKNKTNIIESNIENISYALYDAFELTVKEPNTQSPYDFKSM